MDFGIFAKIFVRPSLEQVLEAVAEGGFRHIQFNFSPRVPQAADLVYQGERHILIVETGVRHHTRGALGLNFQVRRRLGDDTLRVVGNAPTGDRKHQAVVVARRIGRVILRARRRTAGGRRAPGGSPTVFPLLRKWTRPILLYLGELLTVPDVLLETAHVDRVAVAEPHPDPPALR
jgi:hypothetical protein